MVIADRVIVARKNRSLRVIPKQPNHIWIRGNNRRNLFSWPHERKLYIRFLEEALEATKCKLHNIALVTNHVHLNITPPTVESLSRCIQQSSQRYAQKRNQRKGSSGKLFEGRYGSKPILTEEQLVATSVYIDLNLYRAGVAGRNMGWTTLGIHTGECDRYCIPRRIWTPSSWYIDLGSTEAQRQEAYRKIIGDSMEETVDQENETRSRIVRPDGTVATR